MAPILLVSFLYIAFEKRLLVQTVPSKDRLHAADVDGSSRTILGLQVRLAALGVACHIVECDFFTDKAGTSARDTICWVGYAG
jgi:hypothetical protein